VAWKKILLEGDAAGGGGANTALSNLDPTAINTSLIPDTNLTDDLGSSSIYWNKAYVKEVNLNSGAKIDGATANRVTVTATDIYLVNGSGSAKVSVGGATPPADVLLLVQPATAPSTSQLRGIQGAPYVIYPSGGSTGFVRGLDYQPAVGVGGGGAVVPEVTAVYAVPSAVVFTGTVTAAYAFHAPAMNPFAGTPSIAAYRAFYSAAAASNKIVDAYGLDLADFTNNTGVTYLLNLGPSTPYMRLVGGSDPAGTDTNLFLKVGANLMQVYSDGGTLKVK
jgi:hypothetical protein